MKNNTKDLPQQYSPMQNEIKLWRSKPRDIFSKKSELKLKFMQVKHSILFP